MSFRRKLSAILTIVDILVIMLVVVIKNNITVNKIEKKDKVDHAALDSYLESHLIDPACCHSDNFNQFFVLRASKLLDAIQNVTGRVIVGRDSEEVVSLFGAKL